MTSMLTLTPCAEARGRFVLPSCPLVKADEDQKKKLPTVKLGENFEEKTQEQTPSTLEQAQKANLMPLAINQTKSEMGKSERLQLDSANQQLAELWQATIEQSEDIKMAVSLMQPNSDKKHTAAQAARMLSGLLFGASSLLVPAIPGATRIPAQLALGTADGLVGRMIGAPKNEKGPVTAEQSTLIYLVVRSYSNRLQDDFQQYRLAVTELDCAKKLVSDEKQVIEAAPFLREDPLTVMRVAHALDAEQLAKNKVDLFRQRLSILAGAVAVEKLDKSIQEEKLALLELIGTPDDKIPLIPGKSADGGSTQKQELNN
jgi:hypothetical protein